MLTWELFETKYNQMANPSKSGNIGKMKKTAHSQGYDVSEPKDVKGTGHYTLDLTHRKTGEKVKNVSGGNFGGSAHGNLGDKTETDNTVRNQVSQSIKADRKARGGVDKRPEAKEKRKAEAILNREKKKKNRDPFTREHTEWWLMMHRLVEGEQENARRREQMAKGQKLAAPASSAIVKVPGSERTEKESSGIARKSGPGVRVPEEKKKPAGPSKPMNKPTMQSRPVKSPEEERSKAKAKVDQRKDGFSGGVKKALGGDVIGMRGKKGENALQKQERQKMNRQNRSEFAKKKVQQTGNALSAAGSNIKSDYEATASQSRMGSESGKLDGGSKVITRGQRG